MSSSHGTPVRGFAVRGPLAALPATVLLVGVVVLVVGTALVPPARPQLLVIALGLAFGLAVLALVPLRSVLVRLALELPLLVLAATYALAGRGPHLDWAGLRLSRPGLAVGGAVLAKATVGVLAVSALAAATTVPSLLGALRSIGAPRWFVDLVAMSARQVGVLRADLARLRLAVAVRSGARRRGPTLRTGARALGTLFVRATERADRLEVAAALRGAPPGWRPGQAAEPRP